MKPARTVKKIAVLGSTGSVGRSTLSVVRENAGVFQVVALTCHTNIALLAEQIQEFRPQMVAVAADRVEALRSLLAGMEGMPQIFADGVGHRFAVETADVDLVVAAIAGAVGISSICHALQAGKTVAVANKEPLVLAGELLMHTAAENGGGIIPIDSEHNAIFQCLAGNNREELESITLTASGGPFRSGGDFEQITKQEALRHPKWEMGAKITIDSATLMNKALEIIEARWLFALVPEQIKVLIHPQSIIHSMVHFIDGSTLAQMGQPDMRIPIAHCLGLDRRIPSGVEHPDWTQVAPLEFSPPDTQRFPSLDFAYSALDLGGGAPAVLNGANEYLVAAFLGDQIRFADIFRALARVMAHLQQQPYSLDSVQDAIAANRAGEQLAMRILSAGLQ